VPVTIVGSIEPMRTEDDEAYLGIPVPGGSVRVYLDALRAYLGEADFRLYTHNQQLRDRSSYHITFVNPREHALIGPPRLEGLVGGLGPVEMLGIGVAERAGDRAFFVVCESAFFQGLRRQLGLAQSDLHVTLGFDTADVHEVRKDRGTLIRNLRHGS
jgi:hypothetical protein